MNGITFQNQTIFGKNFTKIDERCILIKFYMWGFLNLDGSLNRTTIYEKLDNVTQETWTVRYKNMFWHLLHYIVLFNKSNEYIKSELLNEDNTASAIKFVTCVNKLKQQSGGVETPPYQPGTTPIKQYTPSSPIPSPIIPNSPSPYTPIPINPISSPKSPLQKPITPITPITVKIDVKDIIEYIMYITSLINVNKSINLPVLNELEKRISSIPLLTKKNKDNILQIITQLLLDGLINLDGTIDEDRLANMIMDREEEKQKYKQILWRYFKYIWAENIRYTEKLDTILDRLVRELNIDENTISMDELSNGYNLGHVLDIFHILKEEGHAFRIPFLESIYANIQDKMRTTKIDTIGATTPEINIGVMGLNKEIVGVNGSMKIDENGRRVLHLVTPPIDDLRALNDEREEEMRIFQMKQEGELDRSKRLSILEENAQKIGWKERLGTGLGRLGKAFGRS